MNEIANSTIRKIPKKIPVKIDESTGFERKKQVCGYARVSTDLEDQKNSYEAQLSEYESRIKNNPDWEFVGLYSDEGISGTSLEKREGFKRMIKDALDGKIDLVLVKSISRFARNTVDFIKTIRDLRNKNVEVWFDKENLSSFDNGNADIMLTIYASFAQEESKSISENVKWGVRKRMEKGQRKMVVKTTLGYDYSTDGKIIINEYEARIVKRIFQMYLEGNTYREIVDILNKENISTKTPKNKWDIAKVMRLLSDEKYIGDFIMQKTVVTDFLNHKAFKNDGLVDKFIFHNHHEAIIPKDVFDAVQLLKEKNSQFKHGSRAEPVNKLTGLLFCETCLRELKLKKVSLNTKSPKKILTCKTVNKGNDDYKDCSQKSTIPFDLAMQATLDVVKKYHPFDANQFENIKMAYLASLDEMKSDYENCKNELSIIEGKLNNIVSLAASSNDPNKYKKDYEIEKDAKERLTQKIESLKDDLKANAVSTNVINNILNYLKNEHLTHEIVKKVIVGAIRRKDNSIRFIIGPEGSKFAPESIDLYTSIKPLYENKISDNAGNTLHYDVVKLED